ncbi:MAG: ABC transporter substrate-binding protein [Kiritimatiellae bacterium]|nr:ABC transporter substrate-binding protein [Kiritimatiellia bacterium]
MKRGRGRIGQAGMLAAALLVQGETCGAAGPRIVPGSPALAAIAFEIGLTAQVVGVTQWTRLPPGESRPVVGDAHSLHVEALLAVRPELMVLQGEPPAGLAQVRRLRPGLRVERVELERLADIPRAARRLHELAGGDPARPPAAVEQFEQTLERCRRRPPRAHRPRVIFVVGTERPLVAGAGTFVGELIELAGAVNAGAELPGRERWRPAEMEQLWTARPDLVLVHAAASERTAAGAWWRRRWPGAERGAPRIETVTDPGWVQPSLRTLALLDGLEALLDAQSFPSGGEGVAPGVRDAQDSTRSEAGDGP